MQKRRRPVALDRPTSGSSNIQCLCYYMYALTKSYVLDLINSSFSCFQRFMSMIFYAHGGSVVHFVSMVMTVQFHNLLMLMLVHVQVVS